MVLSSMAIQFNCPYCTAPIRVPDTAAGKKGSCPKCGTKVMVPTPSGPPGAPEPEPEPDPVIDSGEAVEAVDELPDVHKQVVRKKVKKVKKIVKKVKKTTGPGGNEVEEIVTEEIVSAEPVISDRPAYGVNTTSSSVSSQLRRNRRRRGSPLWVMTLFLVGAGVIVVLLIMLWQQNKQDALKGELTGEPVTYPAITPALVNRSQLDLPEETMTAVLNELSGKPLRIQSSANLVDVMVGANEQGLQINVLPGREGSWYRVDASSDPDLLALVQEKRGEWDTLRSEELAKAVNTFVKAKHEDDTGKKNTLNVSEYRNSVGLNSLVSGLGYVVELRVDVGNHRCVYEDSNNRLYFLLPSGLRTLHLRARQLPDGTRAFDGEFVVKVGPEVEDDGKPAEEGTKTPDSDDIPGLGEKKEGS